MEKVVFQAHSLRHRPKQPHHRVLSGPDPDPRDADLVRGGLVVALTRGWAGLPVGPITPGGTITCAKAAGFIAGEAALAGTDQDGTR
ncbi:hypothetical protein DIE28_03715 [Paracoccus thiocyanatus]|uniref:Uncharacterized protein n=1 Tax=Paracoccus thiocyanatus TaxID=34006 RepID=A0A3D8PDX6_9RHOB|nr:hypothetical protein DIE28_03715 [Paracoccus thiocyanatus]